MNWFLALSIIIVMQILNPVTCSNGCVDLDRLSFDKVVKRFRYTLVKFDVAFPYGDKHEAYINFAIAHTERIDELLFALVGIKDYGERENADLGKRFNIPEQYPVIKLFSNETSLDKWIDFPVDSPVTDEALQNFLSEHTNLYIGLPGCLREADELAAKFATSKTHSELEQLLVEAEHLGHRYENDEKSHKSFQAYIALMRKMAKSEKSVTDFAAAEKERVQNLLKGKISDSKKNDLKERLNILQSFRRAISVSEKRNEEL